MQIDLRRPRLREGAVPSLFPWVEFPIENTQNNEPVCVVLNEQNIDTFETSQVQVQEQVSSPYLTFEEYKM